MLPELSLTKERLERCRGKEAREPWRTVSSLKEHVEIELFILHPKGALKVGILTPRILVEFRDSIFIAVTQ